MNRFSVRKKSAEKIHPRDEKDDNRREDISGRAILVGLCGLRNPGGRYYIVPRRLDDVLRVQH